MPKWYGKYNLEVSFYWLGSMPPTFYPCPLPSELMILLYQDTNYGDDTALSWWSFHGCLMQKSEVNSFMGVHSAVDIFTHSCLLLTSRTVSSIVQPSWANKIQQRHVTMLGCRVSKLNTIETKLVQNHGQLKIFPAVGGKPGKNSPILVLKEDQSGWIVKWSSFVWRKQENGSKLLMFSVKHPNVRWETFS